MNFSSSGTVDPQVAYYSQVATLLQTNVEPEIRSHLDYFLQKGYAIWFSMLVWGSVIKHLKELSKLAGRPDNKPSNPSNA